MSNYCMIETAFDNKEELDKVVSKLLENKLVSGCQVIESDSKWRWKNELERAKEYLLFMKTKKELAKEIFDVIKNIHSYDCFEFAVFELTSCNAEYLSWIDEETAKKQDVPNIIVLHSLNADTLKMWGKDIKEIFCKKDIEVIMPEFPIRAESTYEKFDEILEAYIGNGKLNNNSIVIAHSIGNAYFLRFCKEHQVIPKAYIAVAPGAVYDYPSDRTDYIVEVKKQAYVKKEVFDYVKNMSCDKYCLYSDEDDKNIEKFTRFIDDTNSKGMYLKYYSHFDGRHNIYRVPELIELLERLL